MDVRTIAPRFAGTILVNADVLRFPQEAKALRALPGYKGLDRDVLVFETGQERPDQTTALNRVHNTRVRDKDNAIAWAVQDIADRYYQGQRHRVLYKTAQVFPKVIRDFLKAGVVNYFGWNSLGSLKIPLETRFAGTVFVNREMVGHLQRDLGLNATQVPPEIKALPNYIDGGFANNEPLIEDAVTVNFESGQSHGWWESRWDAHKRATNTRINQQDAQVMTWAQTLANRYAQGDLTRVAFQTDRVFTGIDRYLVGLGLSLKRGWNGFKSPD